MALIGSLKPAVSGLRAQQLRIEVIGNNIANVDTPGFKSSRAEFETMLSQVASFGSAPEGTFGGTNPVQIGQGVQVGAVAKNFSQGSLEVTGIDSDLAVSGDGFFVVDSSGSQLYTRDGSFALNAANDLFDPTTGGIVQGWLADENFEVSTGALEDITIPVGNLRIAKATTSASVEGTLNAGGEGAENGTWLFSTPLYDLNQSNTELISAENPIGYDRATSSTLLQNLIVQNGNFTPFENSATTQSTGTAANFKRLFAANPDGTEVTFTAKKGERSLETTTFTVGDVLPSGGTTLGDFVAFMKNSLGIADGTGSGAAAGVPTFSYIRHNPVTGSDVAGSVATGDTVTTTMLTKFGGDFRGTEVGDYIRFTSGDAVGEIAQITSVSDDDSDGIVDTVGYEAIAVTPGIGDSFTINAPSDVNVATEETMLDVSLTTGAPTVSTTPPISSFSIVDAGVTDYSTEHGVAANHIVQYSVAGTDYRATVQSVSGNTITVAYDSALGQPDPTSGDFTILRNPAGSIEVAGNVGLVNDVSGIEIEIGNTAESLFNDADVIESATGESVSTSITVFDSLGSAHQVDLTVYRESLESGGPTSWRYFAESADDTDRNRLVGSGVLEFTSDGQLRVDGTSTDTATIDLEPTTSGSGAVESPLSFEIDFSRLTQFEGDSSIRLLEQDGFKSGTLRKFGVGDDGTITGNFDNGVSRTIGRVALARFANTNGLVDQGSNYFSISPASGEAQIGNPGSLGFGTIRGGTLEESNVDLAEEFTGLLVGQRAFQANARTVTASDTLLQELVNLI